jgi:hypothetical protein
VTMDQPSGATCTAANGSGSNVSADVTVQLTCAANGGGGGFGAVCSADIIPGPSSDCGVDYPICNNETNGGNRCTKSCTTSGGCPAPLAGGDSFCNSKGYCKF